MKLIFRENPQQASRKRQKTVISQKRRKKHAENTLERDSSDTVVRSVSTDKKRCGLIRKLEGGDSK